MSGNQVSSKDKVHECCYCCRDKSHHWYWYSLRQCFKLSVIRAVTQLVMAYHPNYMVPMFSIPQVTWANQSIGQTSVGRFPNPKSVMRICKYRECSQDSTLIFVLTIESLSLYKYCGSKIWFLWLKVIQEIDADTAYRNNRGIDLGRDWSDPDPGLTLFSSVNINFLKRLNKRKYEIDIYIYDYFFFFL